MTTVYAIDSLRIATRALEGARITDVGRTVDMVELGLRRDAEWVRLHIQCPFRIIQNERVLLGSADMRYPLDRKDDRAAAFDARITQFDRLATIITAHLTDKAYPVSSAELAVGGAIRIEAGDLRVEVFPDVSGPIECWRLFVKGSDEHFAYRARSGKS